jgi:hypothetical protein
VENPYPAFEKFPANSALPAINFSTQTHRGKPRQKHLERKIAQEKNLLH